MAFRQVHYCDQRGFVALQDKSTFETAANLRSANYALHMLAKMNGHSQAETNRKNERRRIDGRKNKQTE